MANPAWQILVVDDEPDMVSVVRMALRGWTVFGRSVEIVSATSAKEATATLQQLDRKRFAAALVDVVMEDKSAGLKLVGRVREAFGSSVQVIILTGQPGLQDEETVASTFEISNYVTKDQATAGRIRTLLQVAIRNFRTLGSLELLCSQLSGFARIFETASNLETLDRTLVETLRQHSIAWHYDLFYRLDLEASEAEEPAEEWQRRALQAIRAAPAEQEHSVVFLPSDEEADEPLWTCVVRPLGGLFTAGFALRGVDQPLFLDDLQSILSAWALARESVHLRQRAAQEATIRDEMIADRRESIAQAIAGLVHDVSTPLGIASTATSSLAEIASDENIAALFREADQADDLEDLLDAVSLVRRNIERAGSLIDGFKNLSVRQLSDAIEDICLAEYIRDTVNVFSPAARKSRIKIEVHDELDEDVQVWRGYAGHISQVMLNLFSNVCRYAYPDGSGGKIDVYLRSRSVDDQPEFQIVVRDYGVGIEPENLPLLFEAFYTTGRNRGGSGLGLAIVRNIVEIGFGGSIRCESSVGEGTTFTLQFTDCVAKEEEEGPTSLSAEEKARSLEEFVALQRKLVRGESLPPEEQIRLSETKTIVESFSRSEYAGKERRRHPRIPFRKSMVCDVDGREVASMLGDISEGGASHIVENPIDIGARLRAQYVEDGSFVAGTIVSQIPIDRGGKRTWRHGVRFDELEDDVLNELRLFIARAMLAYWSK